MNDTQQTIHFLFTQDGFCIDDRAEELSGAALAWKQQFEQDGLHCILNAKGQWSGLCNRC